MADNEPRRTGGMSVDTGLVRELADMLEETGLSEIEVEDGDRRIRVARATLAAAAPAAIAAPVQLPPAPSAPAGDPRNDTAPIEGTIPSPMVGTAYLSPEPDAGPFVKPGDRVVEGDTLLIVEAMKVMNPITAPRAGTVGQVLVDNAQPVEFGQPLLVLS